MKKQYFAMIVLTGLMLILFWGCSSCSESDSEEIAEALEDRLTDALKFEGGTVNEGSPPESSSAASAPKLKSVIMSDRLWMDDDFSVELGSDYSGASSVDTVVVYVEKATRHITVPSELKNQLIMLAGTLAKDPEFAGKNFTLKFALQTAAEVTGPYASHGLQVSPDDPPDAESVLQDVQAEGAALVNSPPPQGSSSSDAPQILRLAAPESITVEESVEIKLHTDYSGELDVAILTLPGASSYMSIPGEFSEGVFKVSGRFLSRDLKEGDVLTFEWALMDSEGQAGMYRLWVIEVLASPVTDGDADGDQAQDGDEEPDIDPEELDGEGDGDFDPEEEIDGDGEKDEDVDLVQNTWVDSNTHFEWQNPGPSGGMNWSEAEFYCEGLVWAGHDDWALPGINVLRSLIQGCESTETGGYCGVTDGCASLNCWTAMDCMACDQNEDCYWDAALEGPCDTGYWSSVVMSDDTGLAWVVQYDAGSVINGPVSEDRLVRCVRSADMPDGDMEDAEEEIEADGDRDPDLDPEQELSGYLDPTSMLIWESDISGGQMTQAEAATHCVSLGAEWKVPTIDELRSLVRNCDDIDIDGACGVTQSCSIDSCWDNIECIPSACVDTGGPDGCYRPTEISGTCGGMWSSTTYVSGTNNAWYLAFTNGEIRGANVTTTQGVHCVQTCAEGSAICLGANRLVCTGGALVWEDCQPYTCSGAYPNAGCGP